MSQLQWLIRNFVPDPSANALGGEYLRKNSSTNLLDTVVASWFGIGYASVLAGEIISYHKNVGIPRLGLRKRAHNVHSDKL